MLQRVETFKAPAGGQAGAARRSAGRDRLATDALLCRGLFQGPALIPPGRQTGQPPAFGLRPFGPETVPRTVSKTGLTPWRALRFRRAGRCPSDWSRICPSEAPVTCEKPLHKAVSPLKCPARSQDRAAPSTPQWGGRRAPPVRAGRCPSDWSRTRPGEALAVPAPSAGGRAGRDSLATDVPLCRGLRLRAETTPDRPTPTSRDQTATTPKPRSRCSGSPEKRSARWG